MIRLQGDRDFALIEREWKMNDEQHAHDIASPWFASPSTPVASGKVILSDEDTAAFEAQNEAAALRPKVMTTSLQRFHDA